MSDCEHLLKVVVRRRMFTQAHKEADYSSEKAIKRARDSEEKTERNYDFSNVVLLLVVLFTMLEMLDLRYEVVFQITGYGVVVTTLLNGNGSNLPVG